jgi:hypothetical protein
MCGKIITTEKRKMKNKNEELRQCSNVYTSAQRNQAISVGRKKTYISGVWAVLRVPTGGLGKKFDLFQKTCTYLLTLMLESCRGNF